MKDRLLSGAGYWLATCLVLIVAFGAILAFPYMDAQTPRATTSVTADLPTAPPPIAVRTTRRAPDHIDYEREYEAAALRMLAKSRATPPRPAPNARPTSTTLPAADTDEELFDPIELGRLALAFVGTDPDAEALWLAIINDPDIDPEARRDLIEDLNEDGFPDPDNLTPEHLPLIEARLALLDKLIPEPMDDTNAEAFAEARKDLIEMRDRLKPPPAPPAEPAG